MKFKIGQKVYVSYISTDDKYHKLRNQIIWKEARLQKVEERAGKGNWYRATILLDKPFADGKVNRRTFTISKCQLQHINDTKKKEYSVFDDKRANMLQDINDRLNLNNKPHKPTDFAFWKREFEAGMILECKYVEDKVDHWYDIKPKGDSTFLDDVQEMIDKGEYTRIIEFRYKD